jgi:hypothetical protein
MKIYAVKDESGKIIASFESATGTGSTVSPVLPDGHKVEEVEVADNYTENLGLLYSEKDS